MNYEELFQKYQEVSMENVKLKDEIKKLKAQLSKIHGGTEDITFEASKPVTKEAEDKHALDIDNMSAPEEKIKLFMSNRLATDIIFMKPIMGDGIAEL